MRPLIFISAMAFLVFASCTTQVDDIGNKQSAMGEVGNTFTISGLNLPGVSGISAEVTALNNGVSTVTGTAAVTNEDLVDIAEFISTLWPGSLSVDGNNVSGSGQVRFTENGIAGVFPEGDLVLVHYDAKVGDSWSLTTGGRTIKNEVMNRSTEDDYFWGGFMIKVIEIEGSGHEIPGLDNVTYFANHRFGLVGVNANMSDESIVSAIMSSAATN